MWGAMDKKFDIFRFVSQYHIPHKTEGHSHCRIGWVQLRCPFCTGSPGWHLGFDISSNIFTCWRCGRHTKLEVICSAVGVSRKEGISILKEMSDYNTSIFIPQHKKKRSNRKYGILTFPPNIGPLHAMHTQYLKDQYMLTDSDINTLEKHWGIKGTRHLSGKYNFRIFIPIYNRGKIVSFTTRSINPFDPIKYYSCSEKDEVMHHKHLLYGANPAQQCPNIILTEGPIDRWKLLSLPSGWTAGATFGAKTTRQQRYLLSKYKKIVVWLDPDPAGEENADRLSDILTERGCNCCIVSGMDNDLGGLPKSEINYALTQITGGNL
jgi:hypothetical protein